MPGTRVGPAAAQALQATLVVIFVLLPLFVPLWAIFSFVLVPTAARGLRNTDSTPGPRWLKWPLSLVSLPLKLAAGLAWLLYAYVTISIHPLALLVYEILRLCKRPSWGAGRARLVQVAPADGGPTINVKVQCRPTVPASHDAPPDPVSHEAPPEQGIDHNGRLYSVEARGGPPEQGTTAKPRVGFKGLRRGLGASGVLTDSLETIQERRKRYTRFDSVWTALEGRQAIDDQDTTSVHGLAKKLAAINFGEGPFGDAHVKALAAAFSSGRMPESLASLEVAVADVGDQGATALAAALLESGAACQVICLLNHIGLAGQSALLQVLEAKHGASLSGYVSVAFAHAPAFYPPFLQRAVGCGNRYNWETRGAIF